MGTRGEGTSKRSGMCWNLPAHLGLPFVAFDLAWPSQQRDAVPLLFSFISHFSSIVSSFLPHIGGLPHNSLYCSLANLVTQHIAHTHCYYLCPHQLASFLSLWQNNWSHLFINKRINKESRFVLAPSVAVPVMNRWLCCFWPSVSQYIMKDVHGEAKSHF